MSPTLRSFLSAVVHLLSEVPIPEEAAKRHTINLKTTTNSHIAMKPRLFCILVVLLPSILVGQEPRITFRADSAGILRKAVRSQFDSLYCNSAQLALADSIATIFVSDFCPALRKRLQDAGFSWKHTTFVWINLFCAPNGKVERCIYLSKTLPYDGEGAVFQNVLDQFARSYTFSVQAGKSYSQCGTLRFPRLR